MILSEIKTYLKQRNQATLADIALHFDSNPDAVRGMLATWIRKGKVRQLMVSASCGSSCNKCDLASTEIYEWTDGKLNLEQPRALDNCDRN
ncbi:MAG: sugar metabolism transcriptional regulator [Gammaproteobacteria bacterium]|nr:sugar metabolism transcriptional regulator [Gammaproteobacteria bacterium]